LDIRIGRLDVQISKTDIRISWNDIWESHLDIQIGRLDILEERKKIQTKPKESRFKGKVAKSSLQGDDVFWGVSLFLVKNVNFGEYTMKNLFIFTFLFQSIIASTLLFIIYMLMAILDANDIDFVFLVGQPIMGIIAILITLFLCFILGLPIRLIPKVYNWWTNKPIICFVGVAIGIALILISYNSHLIETVKVVTDGVERTKQVSNTN